MNITFTFEGKEYTGDFSKVQGAGETSAFHLMINKYYKGCLLLSAFDKRWFLMVSLRTWLKGMDHLYS